MCNHWGEWLFFEKWRFCAFQRWTPDNAGQLGGRCMGVVAMLVYPARTCVTKEPRALVECCPCRSAPEREREGAERNTTGLHTTSQKFVKKNVHGKDDACCYGVWWIKSSKLFRSFSLGGFFVRPASTTVIPTRRTASVYVDFSRPTGRHLTSYKSSIKPRKIQKERHIQKRFLYGDEERTVWLGDHRQYFLQFFFSLASI